MFLMHLKSNFVVYNMMGNELQVLPFHVSDTEMDIHKQNSVT